MNRQSIGTLKKNTDEKRKHEPHCACETRFNKKKEVLN